MATTIGRTYVPNPHTDTALRYGLFTVAPPMELPIHAQIGGLEYESNVCAATRGYTVTCAPGATKSFDGGPTDITGDPFVVYASSTCGLVGADEQRQVELVRARLHAGEQAAVEATFSAQANGQAPGLANNGSAVTLTAAATVTAALSALENFIYQTSGYGFPAVIHAPILAQPYFREVDFMFPDSAGVFRTPVGTAISFGNYSGLLPGGGPPAAGHTTFYVTGQVAVYRDADSRVFVPPFGQAINKATNQYLMVAERSYVVTFDCYIAGIDVTLAL